VVALTAVPLLAQGSVAAMADYCFLGKGDYLRYGQTYAALDPGAFAALLDVDPALALRRGLLMVLAGATPLVALMLLWRGAGRDSRTLCLGLFVAAGALTCFPRADFWHLAVAAPVLLLGAAVLTGGATKAPAVGAMLAGAAALVLGLQVYEAGRSWRNDWGLGLPHFAGVRLPGGQQSAFTEDVVNLLACADGDDRPFVVSIAAGSFYLVSGLGNPTPFDYPAKTSFGRRGRESVLQAIDRGDIRTVCVNVSGRGHSLYDRDFEGVIARRLGPPRVIGRWLAYRSAGPGAAFRRSRSGTCSPRGPPRTAA
jgi:hypothetical protein